MTMRKIAQFPAIAPRPCHFIAARYRGTMAPKTRFHDARSSPVDCEPANPDPTSKPMP